MILDVRGYPRFNYWPVLARVAEKRLLFGFGEIPVVSDPDKKRRQISRYADSIDPEANNYRRPIVVLIDARAQSAAESFCMPLRTAKRATFVGSTDLSQIGFRVEESPGR